MTLQHNLLLKQKITFYFKSANYIYQELQSRLWKPIIFFNFITFANWSNALHCVYFLSFTIICDMKKNYFHYKGKNTSLGPNICFPVVLVCSGNVLQRIKVYTVIVNFWKTIETTMKMFCYLGGGFVMLIRYRLQWGT